MSSTHRIAAAVAAVPLCLASAFSPHRAEAQVEVGPAGVSRDGDERPAYSPRAPGVAAAGVALTLAGVPLLVGGVTLLAEGVARDERRELAAIDDLETSGGVLLLGGGGILVGAGVPTIVWGLLPEEPEAGPTEGGRRGTAAAPTAAPASIAVHPRGASATWRF